MRGAASLLICLALPAVLAAQAQPTVAEHIALGDSAHAALAPQQALGHYRAALAHDSTNYAALWKAGREAVDIAKQIEGKDDSSKQVRDSLYVMARAYGEAAVRVNPNGADGHFTVAQAMGEREMPVSPVGIHTHRRLAVRPCDDVETVADLFGGVVLALDLLRDVDGFAPRLPQCGVVRGIAGERRAIVPQGLLRRERRVRAVAQRDVVRDAQRRLCREQRGNGEGHDQGQG